MEKNKLRLFVLNALFAAIGLLLGLTPLGYIPIGPIQITLMCIPVIIATLALGLKSGMLMGAIFALTSFLQIFIYPSPLYAVLFTSFFNWVKIIVVCVVPRLLVPIAAFLVYRLIEKAFCGGKKVLAYVFSSAAATLTNTIFFLGLFYLLFAGDVRSLAEDMQTLYYSMFAVAAAVGAVSELIVCCIVCPPIVKVISKPGMKRNSHIY